MIETSVWVSLFVYPVENLLCQIGCVRIALLIMKVSTYWGKIERWIVSSLVADWSNENFFEKLWFYLAFEAKHAASLNGTIHFLILAHNMYVRTFIKYFTQFFGHYYKLSFSREEQKHFSFSHFLTLNFFQIT